MSMLLVRSTTSSELSFQDDDGGDGGGDDDGDDNDNVVSCRKMLRDSHFRTVTAAALAIVSVASRQRGLGPLQFYSEIRLALADFARHCR